MKVWGKYSADELELQYETRLPRVDYETKVVPGWIARSASYRETASCEVDLAYGPSERECLDFFPAPNKDAPILVYFHGGYWQRGDKSAYSFLAEPFVKNGVSVALVNYGLCPSVSIADIVDHTRRSLAWIWRNAEELGGVRDKLFVIGHSAGGHIAAMLLATSWPTIGQDLPIDMIKGGIPISGLFDLEPLCFTSINDGVRMSQEQARASSPMNHPPTTNAPQMVVCGGAEPSEFHRQSDEYVAAYATSDRHMYRYVVPESDHFDELDALGNDKSEFFQKVLALVTS